MYINININMRVGNWFKTIHCPHLPSPRQPSSYLDFDPGNEGMGGASPASNPTDISLALSDSVGLVDADEPVTDIEGEDEVE